MSNVYSLAGKGPSSGSPSTGLNSVEEILEELRAGRMVVVMDDEDRENEGDLICSAELATPELINFMIRKAGGWICLALTGERADQLQLPQQSKENTEEQRTAFTVSIDAAARFAPASPDGANDGSDGPREASLRRNARSALRPPLSSQLSERRRDLVACHSQAASAAS